MTQYFISDSMDSLRMRVTFKDVVDFRKETIKIYDKTKKNEYWEVYLFDFYQKYLGNLYSWGDGEVFWVASGSFSNKRVTKDGKIYKKDR